MTPSLRTIGIVVHKNTYVISTFNPSDSTSSAECTIETTTRFALKYLRKFEYVKASINIMIEYEAGQTGFGIRRELEKSGYEYQVMAPSSIYKVAGGKCKDKPV